MIVYYNITQLKSALTQPLPANKNYLILSFNKILLTLHVHNGYPKCNLRITLSNL